MMETETTEGSNANGTAPAANANVVYILPASNRSEMPPSPIAPDAASPPSHEQLDLNSSVSNLSWLHAVNAGSLQQQQQQRLVLQQQPHQPILLHAENRNPNLLVNPTTVAPPTIAPAAVLPVSPVRVIEMTMPSGGLRFAAGNINYVTIPPAPRQVYITTERVAGVQQQQQQALPLPQQQQRLSGGAGQTAAHGYISASAGARVTRIVENPYTKPPYSYSCLIALALKNSRTGCLPVSEIYGFMMSQFPYFKTAPDGWKNSVRHNLSLNKCFEKIENPNSEGNAARKGCLWALNPAKVKKMDDEIAKTNKKDPSSIRKCMAHPESFETLAQGRAYRSAEPRAVASSVQAAVAAAVSAGLAAAAAANSHGAVGAGPTSVLASRPMISAAPPAPELQQPAPPPPPVQQQVQQVVQADERREPPMVDDIQFRPGMCPLLDIDDAFLFEELSDFDPPLPTADSSFQRDIWNEVTSGLRIPMDCVLDSVLGPLRSPSRPSDHGEPSGRIKGRLSCAAKAAADGVGGAGPRFRTCPLPAAV